MLKEVTLYHFSPTGGTKKAGEMFCKALADCVKEVDLMKMEALQTDDEVVVFAAPVFAGRIPVVVADKIRTISGMGKKAITVVVYGVRAYDDALLELNDVVKESGFQILASAAVIAQHSIVACVGAGRPDAQDEKELQEFAKQVLEKIEQGADTVIEVPGNYPHRDGMKVSATPISTEECGKCGKCASNCPTGAITIMEMGVETELEKCMLCMACVARCPMKARKLLPQMQEAMNGKLGALKDVRRENQFFL